MPHKFVQHQQPGRFLLDPLPDGSMIVFDRTSEAVHSLNQTAALVWRCCAEPTTQAAIADCVRRTIGVVTPRAAVEDAVRQLREVELIEVVRSVEATVADPSRRNALRALVAAPAIRFIAPLVLTMTVTEQNLLARQSGSPTPTPTGAPTPTPTGTPTPTPLPTPTGAPTPTPLPTPTGAPTPTPLPTPTGAPTPTPLPTPTL